MKLLLFLCCILTAFVNNANAQSEIKKLRFDNDTNTSIHFLPDGKHLVTSSLRRYVALGDIQTGKVIWKHDFDDRRNINSFKTSEITATAVSTDGKTIAVAVSQNWVVNGVLTGEPNSSIILLDSIDGKVSNTLKDAIAPLVFSPNGSLASKMISSNVNRILKNIGGGTVIWNIKTGEQIQRINYERDVFPTSFSPDGQFLAVGLGEPKAGTPLDSPDLIVWDVKAGEEVRGIPMKSRFVDSASFSPDGKLLVIAGESPNEVLFVDTQNWQLVRSLEKEIGSHGIAFSPDGKFLISIESNSASGYVYLLNTLTYGKVRSFGVKYVPSSISFSPNGFEFVIGTQDGRIILYRM